MSPFSYHEDDHKLFKTNVFLNSFGGFKLFLYSVVKKEKEIKKECPYRYAEATQIQ